MAFQPRLVYRLRGCLGHVAQPSLHGRRDIAFRDRQNHNPVVTKHGAPVHSGRFDRVAEAQAEELGAVGFLVFHVVDDVPLAFHAALALGRVDARRRRHVQALLRLYKFIGVNILERKTALLAWLVLDNPRSPVRLVDDGQIERPGAASRLRVRDTAK